VRLCGMGVATGCPLKRTRQERRSDLQHILYALVALVRQVCMPLDYRDDNRENNGLSDASARASHDFGQLLTPSFQSGLKRLLH